MKIVKLRNKNNEEVIPDSIVKLQQISESQLDVSSTNCGEILANKLRKQNKMITLDFEAYAKNFVSGYNTIGSIPSKYLPQSSGYFTDVLLYFNCVVAGMNRIIAGRITSSGNVEVWSNAEDTTGKVGYIPNDIAFRIHESWFI